MSKPDDDLKDEELRKKLDEVELAPGMEPLTPDEKEAFLRRVRAEGRSLTSAEQYALFGPPPEPEAPAAPIEDVEEMEPARLDRTQLSALEANFFPELPLADRPTQRLVQGIIFDFDYTLAALTRPLEELMTAGAREAAAYMRATGMELPDEVAQDIVDARVFAEEKSEEEQEEHIADDAMSFLLQFIGYPVSKMDPAVLRRAVDTFYAPEMTAWALRPGVIEMLDALRRDGYKLALLANYNCDRVFQRTVDYLGLRPYFDMVLTSAGVEYRKPDPQIFDLILERWGVLGYETVVVGDSLRHDVAGGVEIGAQTVFVDMGTTPQIAHQNQEDAERIVADAKIEDMHHLPALIRAWQ
ncbi:MAG: HAD family hydrolase [Caldilineaceae bacterium]|nr:HAD family hydrolase [Caldilineaceae bacterium]MCB9138183.1 HAD family hydrolase [Caldilineaceae bacterium]